MKELIKKIKEIQSTLTYHDDQVILEQVIGMIQEQESKQFNPLELGFGISTRTLDHLVFTEKPDFFTYILEKKNIEYSLTLVFNKSFWLHKTIKDNDDKSSLLFDNIKIPNHRFGVELLKNLGVID